MADFFQKGPVLGNQYLEDRALRSYLSRVLPDDMRRQIEPDLEKLGGRAGDELLALAENAETCEPCLNNYDTWGNRIDHTAVARGWDELKNIAAEEGLIATGYERKYGQWSRIYQFSKLYLFHPSSAVYTCPLAMTDGAARLIEVYGDEYLKKRVYPHLISRNPDEFWTSGQWMTEKTGGSDVSRTQTTAVQHNDIYRLRGIKWFTSAITAQAAMTLARIEENGHSIDGSKGLSLFYVKVYDEDGRPDHIRLHRLKDKLGTRALPTAELTLDGTPARLVGEKGNGVKKIATLFNITRIYNAVCAVANMRRGLALALSYAQKREAFGKKLIDLPLHRETLTRLQVDFEGCFHLLFYTTQILGQVESNPPSSTNKALLRILTPISKLYTARRSIKVAGEVMECFGGIGYLEDSGIPFLLREAQVFSIWEGTTNVLSLDVLRAITKEDALPVLLEDIALRLSKIECRELKASVDRVEQALKGVQSFFPKIFNQGPDYVQTAARIFAYNLARILIASLLLEQAQWSWDTTNSPRDIVVAQRWCRKKLFDTFSPDPEYLRATSLLLGTL